MTISQLVVTIVTSILASELIVGIGHIELVFFGMQYIERGWITRDEYETMQDLYKPYVKLGGNGSGTKIMKELEKLPMHDK